MSYPMARADKDFVKNFIIKTINDLNNPNLNYNYAKNVRKTVRPQVVKWNDMPYIDSVFRYSVPQPEYSSYNIPISDSPGDLCEINNCSICNYKYQKQTKNQSSEPTNLENENKKYSENKIINIPLQAKTMKNEYKNPAFVSYSDFNASYLEFMKKLRDNMQINPIILTFIGQYINMKLKARVQSISTDILTETKNTTSGKKNDYLIEKMMATICSNLLITNNMYNLIGMISKLDPSEIQLLYLN